MSDRMNSIDELIKEIDGAITCSSKEKKPGHSHLARKILVPAFAALLTFSAFYIFNKNGRQASVSALPIATAQVAKAPPPQAYKPELPARQPEQIRVVPQSLKPFYFVDRKNTLTGIARDLYNDIGMWREIYELNKANIANPDLIFVNQPLRLPREPAYSSKFVKAEVVRARDAVQDNQIPDLYCKMTAEEAQGGYEAAFRSIAMKVTGNGANWQAILDYNTALNRKFNKYSLDTGEFVFVPSRMINDTEKMARIPANPEGYRR